jgi:hypothetical protein
MAEAISIYVDRHEAKAAAEAYIAAAAIDREATIADMALELKALTDRREFLESMKFRFWEFGMRRRQLHKIAVLNYEIHDKRETLACARDGRTRYSRYGFSLHLSRQKLQCARDAKRLLDAASLTDEYIHVPAYSGEFQVLKWAKEQPEKE